MHSCIEIIQIISVESKITTINKAASAEAGQSTLGYWHDKIRRIDLLLIGQNGSIGNRESSAKANSEDKLK